MFRMNIANLLYVLPFPRFGHPIGVCHLFSSIEDYCKEAHSSSVQFDASKNDLESLTHYGQMDMEIYAIDKVSLLVIPYFCTNVARRFSWGLGMRFSAKSDLSTGNMVHASYLLTSGDLRFLFTAPYSPSLTAGEIKPTATASIPSFDHVSSRSFFSSHGLGVRAVAIEVEDAESAFSVSVSNGAIPSSPPMVLDGGAVTIAEVKLYGDVVLRYVSYKEDKSEFLPGFEPVEDTSSFPVDYGLRRLDHAVGNVPELGPALTYIAGFTGFHQFAEFTADDVGTAESGLNSAVLASNDEMVLLPINEPVHGTKRKSQIQTYLEHNEGAGLQHLALMSEDIFRTLREMRKRSSVGGFDFMPSPPPTYYQNLKKRVGDVLSDEQIKECEELGILVDRDDQGTLLQIFTKPLGDRPTIFIEIIQRVGCMMKDDEGKAYQSGGCGDFGKGNFSELFKSIEEYEKTLEAKQLVG
ncbi:PREDICTED: 4-hydroxyphenylpyruvate dioxygenase-like [Camelina sativa]|uniref:4-hydroxyphenylpyruvate dioxygenase n=1 Tax=Camelina sativa TaxID=90675 RepID=A0ABM0X477_CAMSA|nr:PREDICTED: 4-hydroxyphenylpyruvate dioxygenase-like [Camelina sativa]